MIAVVAALALLGAMLAWARAGERHHEAQLEAGLDAVLSGDERAAFSELMLPVRGHRLGLDLCALARRGSDSARLTRGVRAVEASAPALLDNLRAVRDVARSVDAIVPVPAPLPAAWRAWRLRTLAGAAALLHPVLVGGVERLCLRVWLLGCALPLGLRWLRDAARRVNRESRAWAAVDRAAADLHVVGDEAEDTLERVVRALRAGRALTEASRARDASAVR